MASKGSIEAGRGHVTLATDDSALTKGLQAAEKTFQDWSKKIMAIGAGVAAAGASITAPFLYGLSVFSDRTKDISRASREMGIGFEDVQTLSAGLKIDLDDLGDAVQRMDRFLESVASGSVEAAAKLGLLGLTFEQLNSMTQAETLLAFADGLQRIGDQRQRIALQREIFRNRHADTSGGAAGVLGRGEQYRRGGGVISAEDQQLADAYNKSLKEMKIATAGLWASIGAAAAGPMTEFFQIVTQVILIVKTWADNNRELLTTVFRVADGMVTAGAIITALAAGMYVASYAFQFYKLNVITSWLATAAWSTATAAAMSLVSGATLAWSAVTTAATAAAWLGWGLLTAAAFTWGAITIGAMLVAGAATLGYTALVWVLTASYAALKAAVIFAAGGFGLWTVAAALWGVTVTAWTAAATVAMLVYKTVLWAVNAGQAVLTSLTTTNAAAIGAAAVATGGLSIGLLAAKVAGWLYTAAMTAAAVATTVATGGINVLVAALVALVAALVLVATGIILSPLALPFIAVGYAVYKLLEGLVRLGAGAAAALAPIGTAMANIAVSTGGALSAIFGAVGQISNVMGRIGSSVASAAATTWTAMTNVFTGLVGTATAAWGGIMSAFRVGDMTLLWEIVTAAAVLAWAQITTFVTQTWIAWKYTFLDVFSGIGDYLYDIFQTTWSELKVLFQQGWTFLQVGFYQILASLMSTLYTFYNDIKYQIDFVLHGRDEANRRWFDARREQERSIQSIEDRRIRAASDSDLAVERIRQEAEGNAFLEALARMDRDEARERERTAANEQERARARVDIANAQQQLDQINDRAWNAELENVLEGLSVPGGPGNGPGFATAGAGYNVGTFSAQAAFGFAGATSSEAPAATAARELGTIRELLVRDAEARRREIAELAEIRRNVMDRFT